MKNKHMYMRSKLGLIAISVILVALFQNCSGQFRTLENISTDSSAPNFVASSAANTGASEITAPASSNAISGSKSNLIGSVDNLNTSLKLTALPFSNVENARLNNTAPYENYTQTNSTYSNVVTLQGLPDSGAVVTIMELLNSKPGECVFAFKINDGNFYCHIKKDSIVKNGDRLQFFALNSGTFAKTLSMEYRLGDTYQGVWSVTTMGDPGTTVSFDRFLGNSFGKSGQTIYSEVLTVRSLGDNVRVPLRWVGHGTMEVAVNGTWYSNTKSMSPEGTFIKNGDKVQIRFAPSSAGEYSLKLLLDSVGKPVKTTNNQNWRVSAD